MSAHGATLGVSGGRFTVTRRDQLLASLPRHGVAEIVCDGDIGISGSAFGTLLAERIPVTVLGPRGVAARVDHLDGDVADLRRRQSALASDPSARLGIAKALVVGKIANQRTAVLRRRRTGSIAAADPTPDRLQELIGRAKKAAHLDELVGIEGAAATVYFTALRSGAVAEAGFTRRERSLADPFNVAVNFCSALLKTIILKEVTATGLDPYVAFLHRAGRHRPALVFDLMEEWRPVLVDATAAAVIGLRMVGPGDVRPGHPPILSDDARVQVVGRFFHRLDDPGGAAPTLRDAIRAQVLRMRSTIEGRCSYEAFRWR